MALVNYLESYLGGLASQLGWTIQGGSYDFVIDETLRLYGVSSESQATDLTKLYALAKYVLWDSVKREVSFDYDYTANGASFKRSQMYEFIQTNLDNALFEVSFYLDDYKIDTGVLGGDSKDPYSNIPYSDR